MKRFSDLYQALDGTSSSKEKVLALARYFEATDPADAAWATYFLAGGKLKRLMPTAQLRAYAQQQASLPDWLFESCYQSVGDLAETITLLLPASGGERCDTLAHWVESVLLPLKGLAPQEQMAGLHQALAGWDTDTRFLCIKLMTGGLRVGVSRLSVTRALAQATGLASTQMAQRLVGYLAGHQQPTAERYLRLTAQGDVKSEPGQPYPFFLSQSWSAPGSALAEQLGPIENWQLEYKWDGIRAQLVCRSQQTWLWSRGEELITEQFPEFAAVAAALPDGTVLDGEILVWHNHQSLPASFAELQKRLGRKRIDSRIMSAHPAVLMVYDLLEVDGQDCRHHPLEQRRAQLLSLFNTVSVPCLKLSPTLSLPNWTAAIDCQQAAREQRAEGLMIKSKSSRYGVGRTREAGLWFKHKLDPLSIDAVLIYAQKGHGRRANLYTDYTFAVWHQPEVDQPAQLVPVAKAYAGLTDQEFKQVDAIIKKSTLESFGPVRRVEPSLVFEIGFEGIMPSSRHKSGVALRFPRMLRWRTDKPIAEANTLADLRALL